MVKDVIESGVKKRRKNVTTSSSNESKIPKDEEIYNKVIKYEENESQQRSADSDAKLFRKTCNDIRQLLSDIAKLKASSNDQAQTEITEKRIQASMLFVVLKKLNRLEKYRTKSGRDTLHKEKQTVDSTQLHLQNLLYESEHLEKEVTKCLQFKSKDEEIDLLPVEEFYEKAPDNISRQDITKSDPHRMQLARLEYELIQRKELSRRCKELLATKDVIAADIVAKRNQLDSLGPQLRSMLQATKPLQESLGLPIDKEKKNYATARLLPEPLYLLYVNVYSYMQACDKLLSVSIHGDEDEAKQCKNEENCIPTSDSDSETELDNADEHVVLKKRHHRKMTKSERLEHKRTTLLKPHPLTVEVIVYGTDKCCIKLKFSYIIQLNLVTVKCSVEAGEAVTGVSAGDLISPAYILQCLYANDTGDSSPNPTNKFQLLKLGLGDLLPLLDDLGRPYIWAQRLCGLEFLVPNIKPHPKNDLAQTSVQSIIKTLRNRLMARIALCKQIQKLESGVIPPVPNPAVFPTRLCGTLVQWTSLPWTEYSNAKSTQNIIENQYVSSSDMFYRAIITRGSAKLVCLVAVGCNYPLTAPVLTLTLHWNGELSALNSDAIRDMERTVNCNWMDLLTHRGWGSSLLAMQLTRVLACFDVFLESEGTSEFPTDKTFFKAVRGRNRARPYKFLHNAGGIFTHY